MPAGWHTFALVHRWYSDITINKETRSMLDLHNPSIIKASESLIHVLGFVYVHQKTSDGGDMYLTRAGLPWADSLAVDNWYAKEWFEKNAVRLEGTSAVYRVPTKKVNEKSLDLVVKNSRVGEHVPLDTKTLLEFIHAEFNSPWEEFALVMELQEGEFGPKHIRMHTQEPLAIYVPPETMQIWQSGRTQAQINRIHSRHPGIAIDILKQYKLLYGWIPGENIVEVLQRCGVIDDELENALQPLTRIVTADLEKKGYMVADMKPVHIILSEENTASIIKPQSNNRKKQITQIRSLIEHGEYSIVDYELMHRTERHEKIVTQSRRHSYLDDQRDRFIATDIPSHLHTTEIMGVPYICGRVESTGGRLWVIGRNARLFDYFLPERWRQTSHWKLSETNEVYYTFTKDHIHLVWKISRVGEIPALPALDMPPPLPCFNSPFEEFAIAHDLNSNGVPTVNGRAIYMTGSAKIEPCLDMRRYDSHRDLRDAGGNGILRPDHNYITLRGYYNGPDTWVARTHKTLHRPLDLRKAVGYGIITPDENRQLYHRMLSRLTDAGYDGALVQDNDMILTLNARGEIIRDQQREPEVRLCNFELVRKKAG